MKYIKANKKVAARLGLSDIRVPFPDGNYLLFWSDLAQLGLGGFAQYDDVCRKVGAIIIDHKQAYSEQHGGTPERLPVAELEEYRMEEPETVEEAPEEQGKDVPEGNTSAESSPMSSIPEAGDEPSEEEEEGGDGWKK